MKKITIIAVSLLCLVACKKDEAVTPEPPIKFQSTAYTDGYIFQSKGNSFTVVYDFIALPSINQGVDPDFYECQLSKSPSFDTIVISGVANVLASKPRETKYSLGINKAYVSAQRTCYYRVIRSSDKKSSETRSIIFNWY